MKLFFSFKQAVYFKQAWQLLKQHRLFSAFYLAGTALAIAMTLTMAVTYYVKMAPVYSEVNRSRILYLEKASFQSPESQWQYVVSYRAVKEWFYPLQHARCVSAQYLARRVEESYIQLADQRGDLKVIPQFVDPAFFQIYAFQFHEGAPFTQADWESGLCVAVITDALARRLFGQTQDVVGQTFSMNFVTYRVCGVVRAASYLTPQSYAEVYIPYSALPGYDRSESDEVPYYGPYRLTFLVDDARQAEALKQEVRDLVHKVNHSGALGDWKVNFYNQPRTHLLKVFQGWNMQDEFDAWATVRSFLLIGLVLLLVPALNLSGMIASRMEGRLAEMGVRQAFGASRRTLLSQVMTENLLLTLLGSFFGLVLAWFFLYAGRHWVFMLFDEWSTFPSEVVDVQVSGEMLFAPAVFLMALLVCLLLNLLSALIPAWHALRRPLVQSLNEKK